MLNGVDLSQFQKQPDFDTLKKKLDFVLIRSSYGDGYIDPQFHRNRDESRRVQLPRGFYHYAYPQYNTPEAEAEWFLKTVGIPQQNEFLVLDFEEKYADPVTWCKKFLDTLSVNLNNYKPLIYLNLNQTQNFTWTPIVNANYGLWLADYGVDPNKPTFDTPWPTVAFLQYADNEQVEGIIGNVDADVFYGDLAGLNAYGYQPIDPCRNIKADLLAAQKDSADNWNRIVAIARLVNIYPDATQKDRTQEAVENAIQALIDNQTIEAARATASPLPQATPDTSNLPTGKVSIEPTDEGKKHIDYVIDILRSLRLVKDK